MSVAATLIYNLDSNVINLEGLRVFPGISENSESFIQVVTRSEDLIRHLLKDCLSAFGLGALRGYYCHLELQIRICLLPNVKFFKLFFDNLVAQSWHDKVSKLEELSVDGLTVEPTFLIDELEESIVVLVELDQELGSQSSHIGW